MKTNNQQLDSNIAGGIRIDLKNALKNIDAIYMKVEDFFNILCEKNNEEISSRWLMATLCKEDQLRICAYAYEKSKNG